MSASGGLSDCSLGIPLASASSASGFAGFSGGEVFNATRRVRDGEDSDEEWDDLSDEELKKDPSWMPAGRFSVTPITPTMILCDPLLPRL